MAKEAKKKKDIMTAVLWNLFVPGVGYCYSGRMFLGVIILIINGACIFAGFSGHPTAFNVLGFLSIVGAVDGYLGTKKYNQKLEEGDAAILVKCPHCAEKIQATAKICKHCQRNIAA